MEPARRDGGERGDVKNVGDKFSWNGSTSEVQEKYLYIRKFRGSIYFYLPPRLPFRSNFRGSRISKNNDRVRGEHLRKITILGRLFREMDIAKPRDSLALEISIDSQDFLRRPSPFLLLHISLKVVLA